MHGIAFLMVRLFMPEAEPMLHGFQFGLLVGVVADTDSDMGTVEEFSAAFPFILYLFPAIVNVPSGLGNSSSPLGLSKNIPSLQS